MKGRSARFKSPSRGQPVIRDRPARERAILDAARTLFARVGYERTTMRAVGRAAGVDQALIASYFGNKEGLFAAVVSAPESLAEAIQGPRHELGRRLTERYVSRCEAPALDTPVIATLRGAMTNEAAAEQIRELTATVFTGPVAAALGGPHAAERAALAVSLLIGMAVSRYILRLDPLASAEPGAVVDSLAPVVQAALDGAGPAT